MKKHFEKTPPLRKRKLSELKLDAISVHVGSDKSGLTKVSITTGPITLSENVKSPANVAAVIQRLAMDAHSLGVTMRRKGLL